MSTIESEPTPVPDVKVSTAAATAHPEAAPPAASTALERSAGAHTLENLLAEVSDEDLRARLMEAYARAKPKRFGLVYEDHEPDAVTLPAGTPVRPGDLVRWETAGKAGQQLFQVETTGRRGLSVRPVLGTPGAGELGNSVPVEDASELRVVKAWGAPVYPGLSRMGEPVGECAPGIPEHMLIQGENLHALQALSYTHAGKVDLIYIDPPYNTGNKTWIYNDSYVAEKDAFRHSKWLAFMEHRLTIARDLLKDTGVIVVSIDENEHHRLRMLMDEVFGAENFISNIARRTGGGSKQNTYVKQTCDYILIYRASEKSPGFAVPADDAYIDRFGLKDGNGAYRVESLYRATLPFRRNMRFWIQCPDGSLCVPPGPVLPPKKIEGSKAFADDPGSKRWRWSYETYLREKARDMVVFKEVSKSPLLDENGQQSKWNVYAKQYFDTESGVQPEDVWTGYSNKTATHRLQSLGVDFPYSKPVELIEQIIRMATDQNAVILDFFAGSGTTGEAVIRLNVKDGGIRQAILVTNNEVAVADDTKLRKAGHIPGDARYEAQGVCQHVTIPRLTSVITGQRPDGTEHKYGAVAGARFSAWKLNYLDPISVEMGAQFAAIAPLLWAESGCLGPVIEEEPFTWEVTDYYGVLTSAADLGGFVEAVAAKSEGKPFTAWIVADTDAQWNAAARALPSQVNARRLWSHYVRSFEINVPGRSR